MLEHPSPVNIDEKSQKHSKTQKNVEKDQKHQKQTMQNSNQQKSVKNQKQEEKHQKQQKETIHLIQNSGHYQDLPTINTTFVDYSVSSLALVDSGAAGNFISEHLHVLVTLYDTKTSLQLFVIKSKKLLFMMSFLNSIMI